MNQIPCSHSHRLPRLRILAAFTLLALLAACGNKGPLVRADSEAARDWAGRGEGKQTDADMAADTQAAGQASSATGAGETTAQGARSSETAAPADATRPVTTDHPTQPSPSSAGDDGTP